MFRIGDFARLGQVSVKTLHRDGEAGIILGTMQAIWHALPYSRTRNTPARVARQCALPDRAPMGATTLARYRFV